MFPVQHRHHEKLAIDVAEVLAKDHGCIPGTADLGLQVRQTALAYQRHAIDRDTVRSHWSRVSGGKEALLLYGRCSCRVHTLVSFCWGDGSTGQGVAFRRFPGPLCCCSTKQRVQQSAPGLELQAGLAPPARVPAGALRPGAGGSAGRGRRRWTGHVMAGAERSMGLLWELARRVGCRRCVSLFCLGGEQLRIDAGGLAELASVKEPTVARP